MLFLSQRREPMRRAAKVDRWRIERYCGSDRATARTAALLFLARAAAANFVSKTGFFEMKTPGIEQIDAPPAAFMQDPCSEGFQ